MSVLGVDEHKLAQELGQQVRQILPASWLASTPTEVLTRAALEILSVGLVLSGSAENAVGRVEFTLLVRSKP